MAKNSIRDYDSSSSNNSDVQSVDISEGCSPSGINNAIREVMADLADVNEGTIALESPKFDSIKDGNITPPDASGTDVAGTDTTIKGGAGTGTGAGGSIIFQTADGGSTGSSVNAHATAMTITDDGNINFTGSIKDSAGTNTALTIDSSGRVFKPATPVFHAYASDNAYQTTSPIPWDTTLIDVGSGFDTTNNKYVVPVTGNYYIAVHVGTIRSNVNGEYLTILLKKGTTTIQQGYTEETSSQGYGNVAFSAIHPLTAGDELTVTTSGNGDYYASKTYTIFSGYLIG